VLAGDERNALLRVADQLSVELGYAGGDEVPGADSPGGGMAVGLLNSEDELLVARVRRGLAKIAAALDGIGSEDASETAVGAALDGAEVVMRGELMTGNGGQLPALMPSFVFLVALPMVDRDRALELSRRTARLIEDALD
jgi:hypothetical protein